MTRSKAIRTFCVECAGGPKDALLCTGFDCVLWPHRSGSPGELRRRTERARRAYARDLAELGQLGVNVARFFEPLSRHRPAPSSEKHREKRPFLSQDAKNYAGPGKEARKPGSVQENGLGGR